MGQFLQDPFLVLGLEMRNEQVLTENLRDLHPFFPSESQSSSRSANLRLDEPVVPVPSLVYHLHCTRIRIDEYAKIVLSGVQLKNRLFEGHRFRPMLIAPNDSGLRNRSGALLGCQNIHPKLVILGRRA